MALTKDDKDWIRLTTKELICEVTKGVLENHIAICPHGKLLSMSKTFLLGLFVGVGLCCGGVGFTVAKILF